MLTPLPDEQRRIVDAFKAAQEPSDVKTLLDPFEYLASANYVVPMLLDLAIRRGNELVDHIPRYSSADHSAIWNDLLACLARFDGFQVPYFNCAEATDPFAEELLEFEHRQLSRRHVITSFERGLWQLVDDGSGPRIRLAERMRRSALHLLATKARSLAEPQRVREVLADPETTSVDIALAAGTRDLDILAESCPDAWTRLQAGLPFPIQALPGFRASVLALGRLAETRWATSSSLYEAWLQFADGYDLESCDEQTFMALLDFHSLTVSEAQEWGIQASFLRFDDTYAAWFFVYHVLSPDLHFLTLLARRYEQLWSRTVGSDLARVADWLGARLPVTGRLRWAARRRRKGIGDADLVLLDRETGHVLVLELKTVFDKFRTHIQLTSFVEHKVNFPKAIKQAHSAARAIEDGSWSLKEIFGRDAPASASVVTPGVLTWWDTFNPTLGTDEPTLCCNFDTFLYTIEQAKATCQRRRTRLDNSPGCTAREFLLHGTWR